MKEQLEYTRARDMLLEAAVCVDARRTALKNCAGAVLAQTLAAAENVPPFDRSAYDGYALRRADAESASPENPAVLTVIEEIPAGSVPKLALGPGEAAKILTGAPIPRGADAVVMYEATRFTDTQVTLFSPPGPASNIVRTGEDVRAGRVLALPGAVIDPGLAGTLAAQGVTRPLVYRRPRVGLISTGSEVIELGSEPAQGKIYNSNRFTMEAALKKLGCDPDYLGTAADDTGIIAALIARGLEDCDMVLLTGGVSAGDYDLTPAAMARAGVELLARGVRMKPGMACAYGVKNRKLVCGLSGNPASAITNFYAVVMPAVKKLCGVAEPLPPPITVTLAADLGKSGRVDRVLRGALELTDGTARLRAPSAQGNAVISSLMGCGVMAVVPAGSGPLKAGAKLEGFLI